MSITLDDAQQILSTLIEVQKNDPVGALGSVTVAGRTVTYKSARELIDSINYWSNTVARLQRSAVGGPWHGRSRASFRGC